MEDREAASTKPLYTSRSTPQSLWQEYRIYDDHVEFETHLGRMVVPFEHIESVRVLDSDLKGLLRGDLRLRNFRPALKLDWSNFTDHLVLDKRSGLVRRILFSPDDPAGFKEVLDAAVAAWRARRPTA